MSVFEAGALKASREAILIRAVGNINIISSVNNINQSICGIPAQRIDINFNVRQQKKICANLNIINVNNKASGNIPASNIRTYITFKA